jgi:EAL domain-containing protein (putative c-di-GMP-specific phosphodiesterase class I)
MHRLKRSGLRFSIDDFGTGHSSLAQLKRLPVNELKIDKSFVTDLLPDTEDERIVHSIIELAHAMSLRVVAEGVENEDGREILHRLGCETAQGYFYSKPLAADEFAGWISQQRVRVAAL